MKKLVCLIFALALCTVFVGCGDKQENAQPDIYDLTTSATETVTPTTANETVVVETTAKNATSPTLPEGAISSDEAVSIALKKADLTQQDVIGLWAELDYDNGVLIYEVDFSDGTYDYDCDIDAQSGDVISFEKEIDD